MSSAIWSQTKDRAQAMTDSFMEEIGRRAQALIPATMTDEQRTAAIKSTATYIRGLDELLERLSAIEAEDQDVQQANRLWNQLVGARAVAFMVMSELNPDQAWFWTPEWQAKEREADRDIAEGRVTTYESGDDFAAALRADM
jgi:hypothetical protein